MAQKVMIMFWWEFGLLSVSRHHITTFCKPSIHYACFKSVFRDSSLYPKEFSLFCLLRLISASADRNGYISNFCSMVELLHQLKNSFLNIEAFRNLILSQQGKRKTERLLDVYA